MPKWCGQAHYGFLLVAFAFIALVGAELVLVTTIAGTNYDGADGMAAQAEILTTLEFAKRFDISNLNPLQGLWPQMMPMNVWVNPAYWPFAFFHKELAAEISGIVALIFYAVACYLMARLFDLPRLPSIIAAQLGIMLFGVAARALAFSPVFVSIPGLAVVYAPHLLALGLLARVSPNRPRVFIIAAAILVLLLYSLYCDPLWTMVSGVAWIVPFGVVTFGPLHRDTMLVRCAVLGGCVAVLLLSGALEYVYSLSQYTARVQFPELLQRPRALETTSVFFVSKYAKYFYGACAPGWALGIWLLRGRPRLLVLAAAVSALSFFAYATAYLHSTGNWWLPLPIYMEHALFTLFWTGAIAGYWGGLEALVAGARHWRHAADRAGLGAGLGRLRLSSLLPQGNRIWRLLSEKVQDGNRNRRVHAILEATLALARTIRIQNFQMRLPRLSPRQAAAAMAIMAVAAASIVPAVPIAKTLRYPKDLAKYWHEGWPDEPELGQFLETNIGYSVDPRFRGSVFFYTFGYDEFLTLDALWVARVPTATEYSQLITPQAIYFVHELIKRNLSYDLNWFRPWINTGGVSFSMLLRTFRALGVRYLGGYEPLHIPGIENFRYTSFPRRQPGNPPGSWVIHEIPDTNVGNYSPTEVTIGRSAAEIIAALGAPNFDFTRQAVLSTEMRDHLVPARDMKLSVIRGGLHVSGRSDGTSLVVLPLQYSHCLRAHDGQARLVRANLIMTGIIFSGAIDTDISFDYGIFSPACRRGDFADMKQLGIKLAGP
jgi:hypothetical protein